MNNLITILFLCLSWSSFAQSVTIRGQALNLQNEKPIIQLDILVITGPNFTNKQAISTAVTDSNGYFELKAVLNHSDKRILLYPSKHAGVIVLNPPDSGDIDLGAMYLTSYNSEFKQDSICDFATDSLIGNVQGPPIDAVILSAHSHKKAKLEAYPVKEETLTELNKETGEQCTYTYKILTFYRDLSKD